MEQTQYYVIAFMYFVWLPLLTLFIQKKEILNMIQKLFKIRCDKCGRSVHTNAHVHSARSSNHKLKEKGWTIGKFGRDHLCPICTNKIKGGEE